MPSSPSGACAAHRVGDGGADVPPLGDVVVVVEAMHQLRPGARDPPVLPPELGRLAGEPVARQRRHDQMERVVGRAAVSGRVGQRADAVEQLDDRAGPAVGHDQRHRVLVPRPDVDEMDLDPVDVRRELRQRIQPRLAPAPAVLGRPVARERLERRELHALRAVVDELSRRPACGLEPTAQIIELPLRNLDLERTGCCLSRDGHRGTPRSCPTWNEPRPAIPASRPCAPRSAPWSAPDSLGSTSGDNSPMDPLFTIRRATGRGHRARLKALGAEVPMLAWWSRSREWLIADGEHAAAFIELSFQHRTVAASAGPTIRLEARGASIADAEPLLDAALERAAARGCSVFRVDVREWDPVRRVLDVRGFRPEARPAPGSAKRHLAARDRALGGPPRGRVGGRAAPRGLGGALRRGGVGPDAHSRVPAMTCQAKRNCTGRRAMRAQWGTSEKRSGSSAIQTFAG